ncbi:MAG: MFS transporter [Lautropia sp.]|nr:MFS transporter [Lautropia sp.]
MPALQEKAGVKFAALTAARSERGSSMMQNNQENPHWMLLLVASTAFVLMVTMGLRMSLGLFVQPLLQGTTLTMANISLAMAVSQLMWGVAQPLTGAMADRYGARPVLLWGTLLLVAGCALVPSLASPVGLTLTIGLMIAMGAGAGSYSILMSQLANQLPQQVRGMAAGVLNAGGSFGQFIFAPIVQGLIMLPAFGWQGAMYVLAIISLSTLPICWWLTRGEGSRVAAAGGAGISAAAKAGRGNAAAVPEAASDSGKASVSAAGANGEATTTATAKSAQAVPVQTIRQAIREAFQDRSYILLHLGFFTCGFHISFLVTHLPTEVNLCGLPPSVASWSLAIIGISNVVGSLMAGWLVSRVRSKHVLFWMYGSRALLILAYLAAPRTDLNFYLFAAGLGLTWLATVPPTATLVGKLFGVRYLATLFGLTLLSHQIGGFLGAWLGGIAITTFGDYGWMWYADVALSGLAAVLNLPIREAPVVRQKMAAA